MIKFFYILATLLIYMGFRSFRGGIEYLRFFRSEVAKAHADFAPFVTVVAPCRGLDTGLERNLQALIEQDYPRYEIIFVVDDKQDDAVRIIEDVSSEALKGTKLVIAPNANACS